MHLTHYWFIRATGPGSRDTYSPLRSLFSRSFFLSPSIPDLLLLCLASSAASLLPSLTANHPFVHFLAFSRYWYADTSSSRTFLVVEIIIALFSPYDDARSPDVNATATDRPYLRRPREVLVKREGERERERPLARARRTYCYRNERPADKRSPWMTNERVPLA